MKPRYKLLLNGELAYAAMHAEDIKAAIRKNGVTPAQIARDNGVSKMAVSHVLHGNSKSARLAQAIAKAARLTVSQIWPGKYPQLVTLEKAQPRRAFLNPQTGTSPRRSGSAKPTH